MTERTRTSTVLPVVRTLLVLAWIVVPARLVFVAFVGTAGFFGEQPTPAELTHSARLLAIAAAVLVAVPTVGLMLSYESSSRLSEWQWLGLIAVGAVVAVALLAAREWDVHQLPTPPRKPEPTHCVTYSGGTNTCPGG